MSFNTSNISCDTLTGTYSITSPIHYVDGIPISKNQTGNLNLGDLNNQTVNCNILEASVNVNAPTGIFSDATTTPTLIPYAGSGQTLLLDGYLNCNNYGLKNIASITLKNGATGSNQFLGADEFNNLIWVSGGSTGATGATGEMGATGATGEMGATGATGEMGATGATGEMGATGATGASANASLWANYVAVQNVDLNNNSVINSTNIETKGVSIYGNTGLDNYSLNYGSSTSEPFLPSLIINPPSQYSYISLLNSTNVEVLGDGSISADSGRIQASLFSTPNNSFIVSGTGNSITSNTASTISGMGLISCSQLNPLFKPVNDFWVCPNGDDLNSGSFESPFQTIQHALNIINSLTLLDGQIRTIRVMTGSYTENLSITAKCYIIGIGSSLNNTVDGTQINGTITINISNVETMNNNTVNISGFLINGTVLYSSSQNATLNMNNCYIYSFNNSSGRCLYVNPTSTDCRIRLDSCKFISGGATGTDPLLEVTKGGLTHINNCDFTAKGQQNVILFSGTATCDVVANSRLECSYNSSNVLALAKITATISGTYTFNNVGFLYSTTVSKSNNANASGIQSSSTTGNNQIVVLYCSFFLIGTDSTNYAIQDQYHTTASQMVVLYYMNGASINNAFAIHATNNQNKFQLQVVS